MMMSRLCHCYSVDTLDVGFGLWGLTRHEHDTLWREWIHPREATTTYMLSLQKTPGVELCTYDLRYACAMAALELHHLYGLTKEMNLKKRERASWWIESFGPRLSEALTPGQYEHRINQLSRVEHPVWAEGPPNTITRRAQREHRYPGRRPWSLIGQ